MSRLLAMSSIGALIGSLGILGTGQAVAAPCGVDLAAPEITAAVQQLAPPGNGWSWSSRPLQGDFNRCATLSTAIVSIEGSTGGSPHAALMFHEGRYLGTATSHNYGRTRLNSERTTDDTVVLDYYLRACSGTCPPGVLHSVRYQWQGDHVEMLDPAPSW